MQSIIIIVLIGLMGGVAVGIQAPLSSMISQRLGILESVFIIHIGGAIAALTSPLILQRRKIESVAHGPLVCPVRRRIWPCGDLFHELHDSPHRSCNCSYYSPGRPASHWHNTGPFWFIRRSRKAAGHYPHSRVGCGFDRRVVVGEITSIYPEQSHMLAKRTVWLNSNISRWVIFKSNLPFSS